MRQVKSKAMRRQVYGNISIRPPSNLFGHRLAQALKILNEFRVIYRRLKRSYRDGACGVMILNQAK